MTNAPPVDLPAVLRAILTGDTAIQAAVNGWVMPLGTFTDYEVPCIVFQLNGGETNRTLDGVEDEQYPTARLDVYHNDYELGKTLADLVAVALANVFQLTIADHLVASINCSQAEDSDEPLLAGQTLPDFVFSYNVAACLSHT